VRVDLHRLSGLRELAPAVLVAADQLLLLRIRRYHGLPGRHRLSREVGDALKLGITVGMICALPGLAVGPQAVAKRLDLQPGFRSSFDVIGMKT
jgi:hypothetical protein